MRQFVSRIVVVALISTVVALGSPGHAIAAGACAEIIARCRDAGYKPGGGSLNGLWFDCVAPIFNRHPQPARATAPLPNIDAKTVNDCRTENPNLLKGKINESKE